MHKRAHLLAGRQQVLERLARVVGSVLERLEERFGVRVVRLLTAGRLSEGITPSACKVAWQSPRPSSALPLSE